MFAFPFAHFYCAVRHLDLLVHHLYQQFSKTDLILSSKPIPTKAFTVKKILLFLRKNKNKTKTGSCGYQNFTIKNTVSMLLVLQT